MPRVRLPLQQQGAQCRRPCAAALVDLELVAAWGAGLGERNGGADHKVCTASRYTSISKRTEARHCDPCAGIALDDRGEGVPAVGAAKDHAGAAEDVHCSEGLAGAAGVAGSDRRGHLGREDAPVVGRRRHFRRASVRPSHPPVGPKRSVLIRVGSCPQPDASARRRPPRRKASGHRHSGVGARSAPARPRPASPRPRVGSSPAMSAAGNA